MFIMCVCVGGWPSEESGAVSGHQQDGCASRRDADAPRSAHSRSTFAASSFLPAPASTASRYSFVLATIGGGRKLGLASFLLCSYLSRASGCAGRKGSGAGDLAVEVGQPAQAPTGMLGGSAGLHARPLAGLLCAPVQQDRHLLVVERVHLVPRDRRCGQGCGAAAGGGAWVPPAAMRAHAQAASQHMRLLAHGRSRGARTHARMASRREPRPARAVFVGRAARLRARAVQPCVRPVGCYLVCAPSLRYSSTSRS